MITSLMHCVFEKTVVYYMHFLTKTNPSAETNFVFAKFRIKGAQLRVYTDSKWKTKNQPWHLLPTFK